MDTRFCAVCTERETCTKICKPLESYLRKEGVYSADYIRPQVSSKIRREERKGGIGRSKYREIPFTDLHMTSDGQHEYDEDC
jgi:hypothetical protein